MSTRAIQFLEKKNIPFEVLKYDHREKGAEFAAVAVGCALEKTIKTLVIALGKNTFCLVLMPGHGEVSLKKLAKACGVKKASMADTATAQRLSGYLVGGISPFGIRQKLPVKIEASLLEHDQVVINGGQRGMLLKMNPRDIVRTLNCDAVNVMTMTG